MKSPKLLFRRSAMMTDVEKQYLTLVHSNPSDSDLEKSFSELLSNDSVKVHVEILDRTDNLIVLQTAKFMRASKYYKDWMIWIFTMDSDFCWSLHRYAVK